MTLPLSDDLIAAGVAALPGWSVRAGKLHWEHTPSDSVEAFGFNVYNRLTIDLSTHDCGGISQRALDLGHAINVINVILAGGGS